MQRRLTRARHFFVCILLFGWIFGYIDDSAAETAESVINPINEFETSDEKPPDNGQWVEVEPNNLLPSDLTGIYYLVPYRNRREDWGTMVSLGYSSYFPVNYSPNYVSQDFVDVYNKNASQPLFELQLTFKRNIALGSIGIDSAAGMYQNDSNKQVVDSALELIPVRLGLSFSMDNIYREPYIVPYGSVGAYTVFFKETQASLGFGGNTQIAPYYSLGLAFQLNWIDGEAARLSYLQSGIENTFIFLEVRQFLKSQSKVDPDFSTGFDWGAGVRVEF